MHRQEAVINILLIVFSLGMIVWIIPAWTAAPQEYGLSGGTLPRLCCAAIAVLAAFQLFTGIARGISPGEGKGLNKDALFHICKYFIPMFCIVPLWTYCGFLTGSVAVILALLLIAGRRDFKVILPLASLLPVSVMLLLRYGLQVPTP